LDAIAQEASSHDSALVIVNTTRDASSVHQALTAAGRADAMHLSTRMVARPRGDVLAMVRHRLKEGQRTLVVSTQLVEAGVDLDFPMVYRAWAPAEALCQAAGRANREGRLAVGGRVVIFDPCDGGAPPDYKSAAQVARRFFGPAGEGLADPDDPDALAAYYRARFTAKGIDGDRGGADIERVRSERDFPEVAKRFRMIDDFGVPVVGRYRPLNLSDAEASRALDELDHLLREARSPYGPSPQVLRALQPWTATLPRGIAQEALRRGFAEILLGDLLLWNSTYDEQRGIEVPDAPRPFDVY
jgi:CRISPR-associated endonuclease/helicase Cas3